MCLQCFNFTTPKCQEIAAFTEQLFCISKYIDLDGTVQWDKRDQAVGNSQEALIAEVFLNIRHQLLTLELLCNSTILTPKNNIVNALNSLLLTSMPRHQITSTSINYYKDETGASSYPIKFLYTVNLATLLPHQLHLKVSYPVILLYNINLSNSLYNKTRLVVLSVTLRLLRYSILKSQHYSTIVQLPYILLYTLSSTNGIKFTHHQFPIKLVFAITINKA